MSVYYFPQRPITASSLWIQLLHPAIMAKSCSTNRLAVEKHSQFLLFLRCKAAKISCIAMTVIVKNKTGLVIPPSVQRRAGIRTGDRLEFKVSARSITITTVDATVYKPTKSELAAIRNGEAALARGQHVSLTEFLHGLDTNRRKAGTKAGRKISR